MIDHSALAGYGSTVSLLSDCRLSVLGGYDWTLSILASYVSTVSLLSDYRLSVLAGYD